jgi:hypothetical protein
MLIDGFESSLDIRDATGKALKTPVDGEPQLDIRSTIFFNAKGPGVLEDVAYPETGSVAPNKDNDDGVSGSCSLTSLHQLVAAINPSRSTASLPHVCLPIRREMVI